MQAEYNENTTLRFTTPKSEVMKATLDAFVAKYPNVYVIDDEIPIEEWALKFSKEDKHAGTYCFYDCTGIMNQYKLWFNTFDRVQAYYAMKCNPSEGMMALMTSLPGICFDCASPYEIETVFDLGIDKHRIIYANPVKSDECIRFMVQNEVWSTTVDSAEEVYKIHRVMGAENAAKVAAVLRIYVDDGHSTIALGSKFGAHPNEVNSILDALVECGMRMVGVSFHVGTGNDDPTAFNRAIKDAKAVFTKAERRGFKMSLLDLGGGWSGQLADARLENELLARTAKVVRDSIQETKMRPAEAELHDQDDVSDDRRFHVISEPGRFFNHKTIHVSCVIQGVYNRGDVRVYTLNEGVMGVFKDLLLCGLDFITEPLIAKGEEREVMHSMLIGPSHTDDDIIQEMDLPVMEVGERILFRNIGAYTLSLTTIPLRKTQKYIYYVRQSSLSKKPETSPKA